MSSGTSQRVNDNGDFVTPARPTPPRALEIRRLDAAFAAWRYFDDDSADDESANEWTSSDIFEEVKDSLMTMSESLTRS